MISRGRTHHLSLSPARELPGAGTPSGPCLEEAARISAMVRDIRRLIEPSSEIHLVEDDSAAFLRRRPDFHPDTVADCAAAPAALPCEAEPRALMSAGHWCMRFPKQSQKRDTTPLLPEPSAAPDPVPSNASPAPVKVPVAVQMDEICVDKAIERLLQGGALREHLLQLIREELEGELGARFSGNLRAVIRREIARNLDDGYS